MMELIAYAYAAIICACLLTGCGKVEHTTAPPHQDARQVQCYTVKILAHDAQASVMEIDGPEPKSRIRRDGIYGNDGDTFKFCE